VAALGLALVVPAATALTSIALSDGSAGAGTNGVTTYEADCTSSLAGSEAAPFIEGLDVTATPDPSVASGGSFGATGTATQTVIGPVVAGLEQALAVTSIGATTTETIGSTDGSATGSYTYTNTFASVPALGRQITAVTWASDSTTLTAAAGTFLSSDVGAFVSGSGINAESTIVSVSTDGSTATLSLATTAAGTSATIGTGMNMTFSDPTFNTGNVFTTAGSPGGIANIGVVGVTGVTVNTNVLNIPFGGAEGVGTSDCLLTGWQNSTTPGPSQDFETSPALPAGTTNPLVLASGGFITQPGTTQAITPPAAAFVNLATTPSVTTTSLPNATVGQSYSATLAASGGVTPYTWSETGLPAGLTLNSSTGGISGTPTTPGTSTVMVTVTDALGQSASASLSLTVASPLVITTTVLPHAHKHKAYSATLAATGGTPPYTWSTPDASALPPGITLSSTGTLSGTATKKGKFTFTVTVTDADGNTANAKLKLRVK
jgi:large repetitive protein